MLDAELFRALGDPSRLLILCWLCDCCGGPMTVGQVAEQSPLDLSVVSRHLALLRRAGIVRSERRGREVYYSVAITELVDKLRAIADALASCNAGAACCTPTQEQ